MTTTVRIPPRLEQMLARYCVENRRSKSEVIIDLLEKHFIVEAAPHTPYEPACETGFIGALGLDENAAENSRSAMPLPASTGRLAESELLLVDTGPLVASVNRRDKHYAACADYLEQYRGRLLTTWAMLTEFAQLTDSVGATLPLYRWVERGGLELLPLGRDELVSAIDWIERYADRPVDPADASLVAALKTGCTGIWTLDRADFETYRLPGRKHFKLI